MSACPSAPDLERLIKGQLAGDEGDSIATHVEGCTACQRILEELTIAPAPVRPAAEVGEGDGGPSALDRLMDRRPTVVRREPGGPALGPPLASENAASGLTRDAGLEAASPAGATAVPAVAGFEVIREVGRGGMGIVYEAIELALGRRVALKVLPPLSAGPTSVARFHREVRAAGRLHHTNIVPIYGVGQDRGVL